MLEEFMVEFDYQLQLALMLLILVMAALTFRAHRQISKLSGMSTEMKGSLQQLEDLIRVRGHLRHKQVKILIQAIPQRLAQVGVGDGVQNRLLNALEQRAGWQHDATSMGTGVND